MKYSSNSYSFIYEPRKTGFGDALPQMELLFNIITHQEVECNNLILNNLKVLKIIELIKRKNMLISANKTQYKKRHILLRLPI